MSCTSRAATGIKATRAGHGDGYSLHVTFGFVKRTGVDWLTWVADRSRERELFRHDLDRWGSVDEKAEQKHGLVDNAARLLADHPVEAYLTVRERERPPPRHVATCGVFGQPSAVVCVADFPPVIEHHEEAVDILATGKKIIFVAWAAPALRLLLTGHPVELAEVTAETGVDAVVLAEVLIKEGVCAELTEALSLGYTGQVPNGSCSNTP